MARELKDELNLDGGVDSTVSTKDEEIAPTSPNSIQLQIGPDFQRSLIEIVKSDWEASKKARDKKDYGYTDKGEKLDFEKFVKELKDLYNARRIPKTVPWKFCSNRSLRIAASILDLIHGKMLSGLINEEFIRWRAMNLEDVPKKERIEKLMRWWIFVHSKMYPFWDNWLKLVSGFGDGLTESFWKVTRTDSGLTESKPVMGPDGNQLIEQTGEPSISKSHIVNTEESSYSRTYVKDQYFLQEGSEDIQAEPVIFEETFFYRELEEGELNGQWVNVSTELKDKIPYDRPTTTGSNPEDEKKLQAIKIRNASVKVLKWYGNYDYDGDGFAENIRVFISPDHDVYLGGVKVSDLTKSGKRPLDFTKYDNRLDRPYENDGEGILEKIKELSLEVDAIFNQLSDANTLSVMRPFFYDPSGDLDAPVLTLGPNKGTPITDPSRNVLFPDIRIPIEQLIAAIRLVLEFIERLTAASSYVMGKESEIVGGSGTATRTNAIMQSASERFTIPMNRLRTGMCNILKTHLDILQLNIPPGLESRILGENGEPLFEGNELSQAGISGEFDVYQVEDPALGSQSQERELNNALYSVLIANPLIASNPAALYQITADLIKGYGKLPEEILGPAPDKDAIDDPEQENTLIIQGDLKRVVPMMTENHLYHIQKHMELLQSPSLAALPPALLQSVTEYAQAHIQQHMQMMQAMQGIMQKFGNQKGASNAESGEPSNETRTSNQSQKSSEPSGMGESGEAFQGAMQAKRTGQSGFNQ